MRVECERFEPETGIRAMAPPRHGILGESVAIQTLRATLRRIARFPEVPVLTFGETGTGKELVALELHQLTHPHQARPFIAINCAALPEPLLESELFGHAAGAFTGAKGSRVGLLEAATGGTLFLDEVGEMPEHCQAKLLRALETRAFRPVGSNTMVALSARIASATNRKGPIRGLRRDLFYRLAGFTVELLPLRARLEDLPILAAHFLERFASHHQLGPMRITEGALTRLRLHPWPGNVRELRSVVEHAAILAPSGEIDRAEIELALTHRPVRCSSRPPPSGAMMAKGPSLRELERRLIDEALRESNGNVSEAARRLGIPRSTLRDKLRRRDG